MKVTDFAPRASFFMTHLSGKNLQVAEIGVDAGSHSHSLLANCDISDLYLIDTWENPFMLGYCKGRLHSHWYHKTHFIQMDSHSAAEQYDLTLNAIFLDITHDYDTVKQSLEDWWPKLKQGGILANRNYAASNTELVAAVDSFVAASQIRTVSDKYHGEIILFKD